MKTTSLLQLLKEHKVVIPMIQRDYAQGREQGKVPEIRDRFLNEITANISNPELPPLELDFIYGYTNEQENTFGEKIKYFTPLDGQQRLTTLYLIHWFVSSKEGYLHESTPLLSRFTYEVRHSSSLFCEKLVGFQPANWNDPISNTIIDQAWFFSAWKNDPTILSMLVMLDAIQEKFHSLSNVWPLLSSGKSKIVFHLLPMEQLGLPDDLYIKMNSRGKELTDFEYFKSQFSDILKDEHAKIFSDKIDTVWSDLLWNLFKKRQHDDVAKLVDAGFLSFFWYITDLLILTNKISYEKQDWQGLVKKVYTEDDKNIDFLFECLDLFVKLSKDGFSYFDSLFYLQEYEKGKTKLFFQNPQVNLFYKCCDTYGYEGKANTFSLGEQLMLYATILNLLNDTADFSNRIRKIRNLIISSEFQIRKEFLGSLYKDIEALVSGKELPEESKLSKSQQEEERLKASFIETHPDFEETVYRLEDHNLLRGTISIFNIDTSLTEYKNCFEEQFAENCDFMEISRAMLTIGDYSQGYGNLRRLGNNKSATWRELLTPNEYRKDFNNTKRVFNTYLEFFIADQTLTNTKIIQQYLSLFSDDANKPKDWIYYYINYDTFRSWNGHYTSGFYYWPDRTNKPYEFYMMFRRQFNGRHWNPFLLKLNILNENCTLENYGNDLQFSFRDIILLISTKNNGFQFKAVNEDETSITFLTDLKENSLLDVSAVLEIKQNVEGIDIEDRIIKTNEFLKSLNTPKMEKTD